MHTHIREWQPWGPEVHTVSAPRPLCATAADQLDSGRSPRPAGFKRGSGCIGIGRDGYGIGDPGCLMDHGDWSDIVMYSTPTQSSTHNNTSRAAHK